MESKGEKFRVMSRFLSWLKECNRVLLSKIGNMGGKIGTKASGAGGVGKREWYKVRSERKAGAIVKKLGL